GRGAAAADTALPPPGAPRDGGPASSGPETLAAGPLVPEPPRHRARLLHVDRAAAVPGERDDRRRRGRRGSGPLPRRSTTRGARRGGERPPRRAPLARRRVLPAPVPARAGGALLRAARPRGRPGTRRGGRARGVAGGD